MFAYNMTRSSQLNENASHLMFAKCQHCTSSELLQLTQSRLNSASCTCGCTCGCICRAGDGVSNDSLSAGCAEWLFEQGTKAAAWDLQEVFCKLIFDLSGQGALFSFSICRSVLHTSIHTGSIRITVNSGKEHAEEKFSGQFRVHGQGPAPFLDQALSLSIQPMQSSLNGCMVGRGRGFGGCLPIAAQHMSEANSTIINRVSPDHS